MTPQAMYEHLVETVKGYNPSANFQQIDAAYEYASGWVTKGDPSLRFCPAW